MKAYLFKVATTELGIAEENLMLIEADTEDEALEILDHQMAFDFENGGHDGEWEILDTVASGYFGVWTKARGWSG